ncbi:PH domain-containing protein [Microdochium trichocladiopsis]|uniref:PH domain-containing protein n=1 Tax=Microdochium trichocladiopsis TaxID=1682393 RepID=A0A9P8YJN9_9PEZI|nr:PH domain-containing protein [Microdochium trichocladiopsis]KAH7041118.1 PH domain-containing protein [Microdochium trichocladiopsis]
MTNHTFRPSGPSVAVMLNEAGLDSPSFRATAVHFTEQVDAIERWLDGYAKASAKLSHDFLALEDHVNAYMSRIIPPVHITAIDHDYSALALKRFGDGAREWWSSMLGTAKKMETLSTEPVRKFLTEELRTFKEARRVLEATQKAFDTTLARYVAQSKTKEPSSLREDAFAVYESRKVYLKASMEFCLFAPQLKNALDKLLVRISTDMWREMKKSKSAAGSFGKYGQEMDRVRGWVKEMELNEPVFKRELLTSRRDIGETALASFKPSREIDDYGTSTVPFLGSRGPMNVATDGQAAVISEKQGWLFLRTISGKPARHQWIRRWYYCKDGIFSWLVNGPQGVLQGDEIGVLLCNAKPAVGEERRFCFEVKTKNQSLMLQAETQAELIEWLEVLEVAKKKAFEASVGRNASLLPGGVDPAFAIAQPALPEFSAKFFDAQMSFGGGDDGPLAMDRTGTLAVPGQELGPRASTDGTITLPKRSATSTLVREEGESGREHAARIMQKLDLHRKATFGAPETASTSAAAMPTGGIASLISASHSLLPSHQSPMLAQQLSSKSGSTAALTGPEMHPGTLAPTTLARPPAPTSLSKTAVVYSGDRAFTANPTRTMPTAILANYWGSHAWSQEQTSKIAREISDPDDPFGPNSPTIMMTRANDSETGTPLSAHKKSVSMDAKILPPSAQEKPPQETFPTGYPIELKTNSAQFRLLFPSVSIDEKLVLVFRASWNSTADGQPNTPQMAGNGRIYVTSDNMYFYGNQMGLVVTYAFSLDRITEATAAPGKDCDFIFLHLDQDDENAYNRITIKVYLENLDLLHARLNLLIDDLQAEEPMDTSELVQMLIGLEGNTREKRSPSADSWENVSAHEHGNESASGSRAASPRSHDFVYKSRSRAVHNPFPKIQLPTHPVFFEPEDMQRKVAERNFEISAKACFHVLFGDKSFVFPKMYFDRRAKEIAQGPWVNIPDLDRLQRKFNFKVDFSSGLLKQTKALDVTDYQTIEVFSDHVTYVVTYVRTPWHLPHPDSFRLVTKIVITHVAKSKCKLALFIKVAWSKPPTLGRAMVERQALDDAGQDAEELADVATDQVRKLGHHSRTKRAIQVYGNVGQEPQVLVFRPGDTGDASSKKSQVNPRTMTSMVFDTTRSFMESVATSLMMWAFAVVKKAWDVVTAQRLLLTVLALSVMVNMLLSSQNTMEWWGERRAAKFMGRMGITPNVVMSKAIYLSDLEDAARGSRVEYSLPQGSTCFDKYQAIMNSTSVEAPWDDAGAGLSLASSRSAARRLRRTRQRLGTYRHDLLVAIRMVNTVEREAVQAEWENWLLDENERCDQAGTLLKGMQSGGNSTTATTTKSKKEKKLAQQQKQKKDEAEQDKARAELEAWYQEYCGSCRADRDAVLEAKEVLSLK